MTHMLRRLIGSLLLISAQVARADNAGNPMTVK